VDIFFKIWAVGGPLIGVVLGAYLSRMWQWEQWLRDNRKQECRELLSSISTAYMALAKLSARTTSGPAVVPGEEEKRTWALVEESYRILSDRIFIAEDVQRLQLGSKWINATNAVDYHNDLTTLSNVYTSILKDVVTIAAKSS